MGVALENRQLFNDLKSSRDKLDHANNVKDEFLGVVSHELRTPINVIMGYTTLLKEKAMGDLTAEQADVLSKVSRVSRDLLAMVDSILYITSLEVNQVGIEREKFNLVELLNEIRADYETSAGPKVALIWDYATELPRILSDPNKLKRVLQNLLNNAIKFTDQGQIAVRVKLTVAPVTPSSGLSSDDKVAGPTQPKEQRSAHFAIADTGNGIPAEAQSEIFNKFYQVDSSRTRRHEGTGLGLYVVKKFTEILGGTVNVQSELGNGSTFTISIPTDQ